MPTAAKLFAAILIAVLGYFTAAAIAGYFEPHETEGAFRYVAAACGLLVGWKFLGPRAGGGIVSGIGLGLSSAIALVLLGQVVFSGYIMIVRALRKSYHGPFEALQGMVGIAIENLRFLEQGDVIAILVLGGIASGILTELVARRWS